MDIENSYCVFILNHNVAMFYIDNAPCLPGLVSQSHSTRSRHNDGHRLRLLLPRGVCKIMNRSRVSAGFMVAAVAALASLSLLCSQTQQTMSEPSRLLSTYNRYIPLSEDHPLPKYNQSSIELMRHMMPTLEAMLLVFDGQTFRAYCVGERSKMLSFRYVRLIPLMVDALRSNDPERFAPGQPVFQMVWTVADFLRTKCVNVGVECPYTNDFPPIASYATMHRDKSVLPTAQAFPNVHYIKCLYGWRLQGGQTCTWQEVDKSPHWEDLTPTVVWRGTDFEEFITTYDRYKNTNDGWLRKEFTPHKMAKMSKTEIIDKLMNHWNDISPRWRAAALTLKTKGSASDKPLWIDTMFTGHFNEQLHNAFAERGLAVSEDAPMDGKAMSKYRYQIDYGGGKLWDKLHSLSDYRSFANMHQSVHT